MTSSAARNRLNELGAFWKKHGSVILEYGLVPAPASSMGIGANTYRAYGKFVRHGADDKPLNKPGDLFSTWARENFEKCELPGANDFCEFHERARNSLATYWKRSAKWNIEVFPYACKLIDLHIKHVLWHRRGMSKSVQARLLQSAFQPLDRHSLLLLRELDVLQVGDRRIPKNVSMGLVDTEDKYLYFQNSIRRICRQANVPAFAFDHFAWNSRFSNEDEASAS